MKRVLILMMALLAGCASSTEFAKIDSDYAGPAFEEILVIGVGDNQDNRKLFEDRFAARLELAGVKAIASHTVLAQSDKLDKAEIAEAIRQYGIDAVLVTRLAGMQRKDHATYEYKRMSGAYNHDFYGYYSSAWDVWNTPQYVRSHEYKVAWLETNIWAVAEEDKVWSGTTKTTTPRKVVDEVDRVADVLIKQLKAQGLLN